MFFLNSLAHDEGVERQLSWVHILYLCVNLCIYEFVRVITILYLVLDIEQLSVHDVKLCVTDAEDVASNIS